MQQDKSFHCCWYNLQQEWAGQRPKRVYWIRGGFLTAIISSSITSLSSTAIPLPHCSVERMPSRLDAEKLHRPYESFGQWPQIWYAMNERAAKKAEEGLIKGLFYI